MKSIRSLIGRRQFLVAAGVTSALGLGYKKLAGIFDSGLQMGVAMASEGPEMLGNAGVLGHFSDRYSHLLSPIKIGNVVLKNRMIFPNAIPKRHQGPENFPAWEARHYIANLAKNGAAIITLMIVESGASNVGHEMVWDLENSRVQNYFDNMAEGVHCYGSLLSYPLAISSGMPSGMPGGMPGSGSAGGAPGGMPGMGAPGGMPDAGARGGMSPGAGAGPTEVTSEQIEAAINKLKFLQKHGYDMVTLRRNGNYSPIELYKAIKSECGQEFLIEEQVYITGPSVTASASSGYGGGTTVDKVIASARQLEGLVDILQVKSADRNVNHPIGYTQEKRNKPVSLRFAEELKEGLKKRGVNIVVAPNGGFQDLDFNEECIASGKCDMIVMGRAFISDHDYGKKAYEGRGEDVVPCVLCNKCHGISMDGPWISGCSVNPAWGISAATTLIESPGVSRKVAVIGGGPGGMKAALTAVERGHKVTIYEKNDFLGGQLKHADFALFQWPYKEYKDYLIRQVKKAGIEVILSTRATPEMIKAKGYDAVLVGVGAEPIIPEIPGANGSNVRAPIFVFGDEKAMGKNVAIVGGGESGFIVNFGGKGLSNEDMLIGVATGIYLAQSGHNVTLLTSRKEALTQWTAHFPEAIVELINNLKNFSSITDVTVTRISEGKVNYRDAKGNEKSIQADDVVVSVGRQPRRDEALKFAGSADRVITLGDCTPNGGSLQRCVRSGYFAASQI